MDDREMLPCPFCGGSVELRHRGNASTLSQAAIVICSTSGCGAQLKVGVIRKPYSWAVERVIAKWNTRAAIGKEGK